MCYDAIRYKKMNIKDYESEFLNSNLSGVPHLRSLFGFPSRIKETDIKTVRDLLSLSENQLLAKIPKGRIIVSQIKKYFKKNGLWLGMALQPLEEIREPLHTFLKKNRCYNFLPIEDHPFYESVPFEELPPFLQTIEEYLFFKYQEIIFGCCDDKPSRLLCLGSTRIIINDYNSFIESVKEKGFLEEISFSFRLKLFPYEILRSIAKSLDLPSSGSRDKLIERIDNEADADLKNSLSTEKIYIPSDKAKQFIADNYFLNSPTWYRVSRSDYDNFFESHVASNDNMLEFFRKYSTYYDELITLFVLGRYKECTRLIIPHVIKKLETNYLYLYGTTILEFMKGRIDMEQVYLTKETLNQNIQDLFEVVFVSSNEGCFKAKIIDDFYNKGNRDYSVLLDLLRKNCFD